MKEIFRGKRISLILDQGKEIVLHPGAVVILPIIDDYVVLIKNRRHAVNSILWELPAGTLEKEEAPELCAARELEEETGYKAQRIIPLFEGYSTPGFTNEKLHFFLATDLTLVGQKLDADEEIVVEKVAFDEAIAMVERGTICDLKTEAGLLFYKLLKQKS